MTRIDAENLAYIKSREDSQHHYFAKPNSDGTWRVDSQPVKLQGARLVKGTGNV